MRGAAFNGIDWNELAAKAGRYGVALAGLVVGLLSLPALAESSPARLVAAFTLAGSAVLAIVSGRSLFSRGDATEGAARVLIGVLAAIAAFWFSDLLPSPRVVQASTVSGHMNDVIRTVASAPPRAGLDRRLSWTVYPADGAAARVQSPLEQALAVETADRPLPSDARRVAAGVRLTGRAGSLAAGQVRAEIRVALAAEGAPQCVFSVVTPQPMPVKAAAEWLADQAVNRAQTYVEGSDAC